jgi:uncharacterized membrane protein
MSSFLTAPWIFTMICVLLVTFGILSYLAFERSRGNAVDIFGGTLVFGALILALVIVVILGFAASDRNANRSDQTRIRKTECATKIIPGLLAKQSFTPSDLNLVVNELCK